jgi:hypothetical protein
VRDMGIQHASDEVIFDHAARERRILISADTDFSAILAARKSPNPSLILFRQSTNRSPNSQLALLRANMESIWGLRFGRQGSVPEFPATPNRTRACVAGFSRYASRHPEFWAVIDRPYSGRRTLRVLFCAKPL